jgi:hypothetical protein
MSKFTAPLLFAALMATPALGDEFTPMMQKYYEREIAEWANSTILIEAINTQNTQTVDYDQAKILAMDDAWRNEVGSSQKPTITSVINNAAAEFLRERVTASDGRITEVFIMDARGLNVAASDITSDYWQGDEAKFSETHGVGPGAIHLSGVELDESTQRYQGQISLTISDPATGQAIGAMTVGVDVEALM